MIVISLLIKVDDAYQSQPYPDRNIFLDIQAETSEFGVILIGLTIRDSNGEDNFID
jgi:hypothetical protein